MISCTCKSSLNPKTINIIVYDRIKKNIFPFVHSFDNMKNAPFFASVIICIALGCVMQVYFYRLDDHFYRPRHATPHPLGSDWNALIHSTWATLAAVIFTAMLYASQDNPVRDFGRNADVAARAWKLDRERVKTIMRNNGGIFPHGLLLTNLLAYPPSYGSVPRTAAQVTAERDQLLEPIEHCKAPERIVY